jgi:hypothetical protein
METKTESRLQADPFPALGAKGLEALAALAQVNQAVMGQLVELGSAAAREALRACAEMGSASLDAARSAPAFALPSPETLKELRQDPFALCRKALVQASDDAELTARLFETGAQIAARGAERFQATADRAGKDIRAAMTGYTDRIREIYASS